MSHDAPAQLPKPPNTTTATPASAASAATSAESAHIYDELLAVHGVMRRGAHLLADAAARLASGDPVDAAALVSTGRWLVSFVHHHHSSEDELFWPVLRTALPERSAVLDALTADHTELDARLGELASAIAEIDRQRAVNSPEARRAALVGAAALGLQPAAEQVRDLLAAHLDAEEPELAAMFPQVSAEEIRRLRAAVVAGAPRSRPDLVLGLLETPEPVLGRSALVENLPAPVRLMRPLMLRRFNTRLRKLGARA